MRRETLSVHGGFVCDPATHAVAPPIYQNVAYEFDSADQAAGMFNLEIPGFRYSRIANPTSDILERRVALLEGGVSALCVATGQAALAYAFLTLADRGGSIVAPPTLYGTTHTLLAHTLKRNGIVARFAKSDPPEDIAAEIDDTTRAVFCESIGNPAGNICDIEALADIAHGARRSAHRRQYGCDADPAAADRTWRRHCRAFADQVHGRPRRGDGRRDRRRRPLRLAGACRALPDVQRARRILSRPRLRRPLRRGSLSGPRPLRLSAHDRRGASRR